MAKDRFELKEEHIKLLQNMYWEYSDCETGGPAANCKRPYGNSYVPPDVAKILGVTLPDDDGERYNELEREIMRYHYESHTALEIILQTRSFKPGLYRNVGKRGYENKWERVK